VPRSSRVDVGRLGPEELRYLVTARFLAALARYFDDDPMGALDHLEEAIIVASSFAGSWNPGSGVSAEN
jgi:hypothetical protein